MVEHLLKGGSYFITICGVDTENKDDVIAHFPENWKYVTCKSCVAILRRLNEKKL